MNTRGYFVTGTDTGVGKTFFSSALVRRAVAAGHRAFAFKPIETGCSGALGEDQTELVAAAGSWQIGALAGLYQFELPAAPLVAAEAEHRTIDLDELSRTFQIGAASASFVVVEGAGGWRVPINRDLDMGGLAAMLGLPVVLVARATLGTINHTLLSAEAIQRDGCELAAIVVSCRPDDPTELLETNLREIARRAVAPIVLRRDPAVLDVLL